MASTAPQSRYGRQYERFHSWNYSTSMMVMAIYYQQVYAVDVAVGMIRQPSEPWGREKYRGDFYRITDSVWSSWLGSKVLP